MWCSTSSTVRSNSSRICSDRVAELVDLAVGEPGGRLVHQQEPRPGRQGPGDLQALERAERQAGGRAEHQRPETELGEQIAGEVPRAPVLAGDADPADRPAEATLPWLWAPTITFSSRVIDGNRARFWNVLAMPRAAMPWAGTASRSLPSYVDAARGRLVDPADDVEHRRLAGAVGADQPADVPCLDRERRGRRRATMPPKRTVTSCTSTKVTGCPPTPRSHAGRGSPADDRYAHRSSPEPRPLAALPQDDWPDRPGGPPLAD